jgi:formate dehydrogenase iron-sulfur subunit
MALPLLTSSVVLEGVPLVHVSPRAPRHARDVVSDPRESAFCGVDVTDRLPDRQPGPGEQYRFHMDMDRCIGCKCCVVACNEQNGNPASVTWRRVGELESGVFPDARRAYFSMGCNHCLDPTCLAGCPVDAYSKDDATGIVRHSAETCIGCQYCTWTCSYGVPQFNPARGVVGKCDMCHGRLAEGQAPACVSACPEGAIAIEIVNVADWRAAVAAAEARTGTPDADTSLSSTRVTRSTSVTLEARPTDLDRLEPADPHMPLVAMTVLTQLSVGAFVMLWLGQLAGAPLRLGLAAAAAAGVGGLALGAATLHLGRPIHAYRAMKMWRRSWLSREVVLFGAFSHVAALYAAMLWFSVPGRAWIGGLTATLGLAGVIASGCIYLVASRPAWNSRATIAQFLLTAALLGPLAAGAASLGETRAWRGLAIAAGVALLAMTALRLRGHIRSASIELRGTARLLTTTLARPFVLRLALLAAGGIVAPAVSGSPVALGVGLGLALAGELVGRYLFFVSAVTRHMTAAYFPSAREAA